MNVFLPDREAEQELEMMPDTWLSYHKATAGVSVERVTGTDCCAWKEGIIRFTDQTFIRLVPQLERKFNVRIQVESARLSEEIFFGSFTADHTLYDILEEVNVEKKYTWTRQGGSVIIRDK
ncbi:MAG: DUF4974 domain-containing protein [Tannerellaceae bacterium]|nr:DUF4974 domain-containing protein [Tannerellaceae bacterium]